MMSKANAVRQENDEQTGRKVQAASGLAVSRYRFLEFGNKPVLYSGLGLHDEGGVSTFQDRVFFLQAQQDGRHLMLSMSIYSAAVT